jgi:hypothetical protein
LILSGTSVAGVANADSVTNSVLGVQGYDLVSYHQISGPVRGDGSFVVDHDDVTYLFSSIGNKEKFAAAHAKYLPAYGGYCAYGVKVGKKFYTNAEAWKLVDGKLYLNINKKTQTVWLKDIPTHISEADVNWKEIKDKNLPSYKGPPRLLDPPTNRPPYETLGTRFIRVPFFV